MKIRDLMLFAYDFPHKKTQDFILRLLVEKYKINYVIAAPWKKIEIPKSTVRIVPENLGLIHPKKLSKAFNIPFFVWEHNSKKTIKYLRTNPVDLSIIAGARILSKSVIEAAKGKILNIHPGLLPEVRGLDTLLWSVYYDIPPGISAHLISAKIDSGLFIYREKLLLKKDDTIIDVSLRLLEKQSDILIKSLKNLQKKQLSQLTNFDFKRSYYNTKMSEKLEKETVKRFPLWLKKYSYKT